MKMKTFDEFIQSTIGHLFCHNGWVKHPGFSSLYVRAGRGYIGKRKYLNVITIANVTAKKTGKGTFTKFIHYIRKTYPKHNIIVENVQTQMFIDFLLRAGFKGYYTDVTFYLKPNMKFTPEKKNATA